jgi:hypothetical protein
MRWWPSMLDVGPRPALADLAAALPRRAEGLVELPQHVGHLQ